jgi:anti-anti-sigma factor
MSALPEPDRTATTSSDRSAVVIGRYQGTVVVTVHGELDRRRAADVGRMLADLINGQGNLSVVVDLHDATATNADRVSVFADAAEWVRRRGGVMTLSNPPTRLHEALRRRGLGHLVDYPLDRRRPEHLPTAVAPRRREWRAHPAGRARSGPEEERHGG